MIGRGLFLLIILSNCVLSLPVTSSQLENEDVEVIKCVVEALADVLSRPHHAPVSQECLVTLKTDDRLVTILRHHNFLKELQEIALQGGQLQKHADPPTLTTPAPRTTDNFADRSMLEALGGPGERSILSQRKSAGKGDGREGADESADDSRTEEEKTKRKKDKSRGSPVKTEEEKEEGGEEYKEKRANSEENYSERENEPRDKKGDGSDGKGDVSTSIAEKRTFEEEDDDKHSQKPNSSKEVQEEEEEEEGVKRKHRENLKRWTKRAKPLQLKKKRVENESQLPINQKEVPHHSKEITEEDEEEEKKKRDPLRSPEEKELQMIARRAPEESRGMEEEGSASRKPEEPEIESLAAIESELENVAHKLHELRRG